MAFLYINTKGKAWHKHSYSAGNDFDVCAYKYYLRRVLGWRERDNKARLRFGRALEEAIQFHNENQGGGVSDFLVRWDKHRDDKTLIYTKVEKDWENLKQIGFEMMRLYEVKLPNLPIPMGSRSIFQREYSREVFPGNKDYGEIEDAGKIDIVAYNDPHHPLLPPVEWKPEMGVLRPLIVDIKTAGTEFPPTPGIAAFDKQLRRYSWLSGIPDVAILWFKKSTLNMTKGCTATLLEDAGEPGYGPGDEVIVAAIEDDGCWVVKDEFFITQLEDYQGVNKSGKLDQTKFGKARREEWLEDHAVFAPDHILTRQRLQFNCGRVTKQSADEAGQIAARQIVGIVNAWSTKSWPNTFGIRYPNDDTRDPFFRAFVLGDTMFQKENFVRAEDELFDDEEDTEAES